MAKIVSKRTRDAIQKKLDDQVARSEAEMKELEAKQRRIEDRMRDAGVVIHDDQLDMDYDSWMTHQPVNTDVEPPDWVIMDSVHRNCT